MVYFKRIFAAKTTVFWKDECSRKRVKFLKLEFYQHGSKFIPYYNFLFHVNDP